MKRVLSILFLALIAVAGTSITAQVRQSITGQVKDSSGAGIPGAAVVVRSGDTAAEIQLTTDTKGQFATPPLVPGQYRISVASSGFASTTAIVLLSAEQGANVELTMNPDVLRQTITVTGDRGYQLPTATTATRTDTPLMDIPESVQVISRDSLSDQQIVQIGEAARNVSGVTRTIGFTERGDKFLVRGLLIDYSLKNGFKNNSVQSIVDVANIERIEVAKGPSSVLYGRIEPGGVVNVVTRQPLSDHHYSAELLMGRYSLYRPSMDASGPLNRAKTLLYRLNTAYERSGSYVDFVRSESTFVAPVLTWRAANNTTLTVEGEHLNLHGRPNGGLPADAASFDVPVRRNIGESTDSIRNESGRASYYLTHVFNERWWITNGFSGQWIDSRRFHVYGPDSAFRADKRTIDRRILDLPENSESYFERADLVGKFKTGEAIEHTLLSGLELSRERFERALASYPINPIDVVEPVYGLSVLGPRRIPQVRNQGADTGGIYVQDQISFLRRWKLLVGLRYDISKTMYRDYSPGRLNDGAAGSPSGGVGTAPGGVMTGPAGGAADGSPDSTISETGACGPPRPDPITGEYTQCSVEHPHALSPRAGILFQPAASVSLYASYSKSFNPLQLIQYLNFQFVKPFIGKQYEAGVKLDLLENRIQATADLYHIVHTGFPLINRDQPFAPTYSGYRRSKGAELDIVGQVKPGWSLTTSYAFNQGYLKTGFPSDKLLGAPRHSFNVWSVYDFQRGWWRGVSAGLGASYVGARNGNLFATFTLPAYTRADAMLAYGRSRWRVQLNLKNLANHRSYETDAVQGLVFPGAPFTIDGALRLQF